MSAAFSLPCTMPGIVVLHGQAAQAARSDAEFEQLLSLDWGRQPALRGTLRVGERLVAGVVGRGEHRSCKHVGADGISVLLDGFITDVVGAAPAPAAEAGGAELVADLYRRHGAEFLPWLRGSFVGLIVDHRTDGGLIFTDRAGSRPMFMRRLGGGTVFSPRVRFLAKLGGSPCRLRERAVGEFLLRGCFYGNDTLFDEIERIGQAARVDLTPAAPRVGRYWTLRYLPDDRKTEAEHIDQLDAAIRRGFERLLPRASRPVLLLSGGNDSRIMLAYLLQQKQHAVPTVSYAVAHTDGDDHLVAAELAEVLNLQHETYVIEPGDFTTAATKEVLASDGRVQVMDAPSNRWEYIAGRFDGMWLGIHSFGFKDIVATADAALDLVGWWNFNKARRVGDWFRRPALERISDGIEVLRRELVQGAGDQRPNDVKDYLFYTERLGNLILGYSARRLNVAEELRPLLDEDVVTLVSHLPAELRRDKTLARRLLRTRYPELDSLPYSTRPSVPWQKPRFLRIVSDDAHLKAFIVDSLSKQMDSRLQSLLDEGRLSRAMEALFRGERLAPLRGEWWAGLPGLWRYAGDRADGVNSLQGVLRLLNLNLYLQHC